MITIIAAVRRTSKESTNATRIGSRVTWRPPLVGWIKCNVDAAFDKAHSAGATAAVFKDHNGTLLSGINSTIVATSPLAAEALAVRAALIMSRNFQMQKVIIELDNQILIQALKSHASIAEIQVILQDILHLVRGIPSYGFTWVPREANSLAHEVVKLTGHEDNSTFHYIVRIPEAELRNGADRIGEVVSVACAVSYTDWNERHWKDVMRRCRQSANAIIEMLSQLVEDYRCWKVGGCRQRALARGAGPELTGL
ncbi:hypothetical protein AHAS_Ahas19G0079800 [Arachis hypogaea]